MTLFYCTTYKVRVSSICVKFVGVKLISTLNYTGNTQHSTLFWLNSCFKWHIELKFYIWLCLMYYRSSLSVIRIIFIRPSSDGTYYGMVMSVRPSVRVSVRRSIRPSVRHSFPHFSPTCFEILRWNFVYHFILMHVRASSNAMNFRQFLLELCPFLTSNIQFSAFFSYMLWDIELKFCIWLCFTVLQIKFECC